MNSNIIKTRRANIRNRQIRTISNTIEPKKVVSLVEVKKRSYVKATAEMVTFIKNNWSDMNAKEFSVKLGISVPTVYNIARELRDNSNGQICSSKKRGRKPMNQVVAKKHQPVETVNRIVKKRAIKTVKFSDAPKRTYIKADQDVVDYIAENWDKYRVSHFVEALGISVPNAFIIARELREASGGKVCAYKKRGPRPTIC